MSTKKISCEDDQYFLKTIYKYIYINFSLSWGLVRYKKLTLLQIYKIHNRVKQF